MGTIAEKIKNGLTYLGIEFGSTRIKAVLTDDNFIPVAGGGHSWENSFKDGYWTYSQQEILDGLRSCYADLADNVKNKYGIELETVGSMGISAMMHGYMAFDSNDELLVPFRTWRNTTTSEAADMLTKQFGFNIPQRWSIAHLWQAIISSEPHVKNIAYVNTLAGYIHKLLTGRYEVGIGEASGIFPVDENGYNKNYEKIINDCFAKAGFDHKLNEVFPAVRKAGGRGAYLTEEGALLLDPTGKLKAGIPVCPPEGDAGTGMVATNSVLPRTGNISAGTSIFSMLVLEKPLADYYPEIDIVTTPDGAPVAMVHCNNCCGELDQWVNVFYEFSKLAGIDMDKSKLYGLLYNNAMNAKPDCGGVVAYNYISGEPVTGIEQGKPMYMRNGDHAFDLGEFFRAQLYSSMASLKIGMDILFEKESVQADKFTGHGGLFKVSGPAQQILADGLRTDVSVMKTAGEGGAWGMALLAAYMNDDDRSSLPEFLDKKVFCNMESSTLSPNEDGTKGFDEFITRYKNGLAAQKATANV